MSEANMPPVCPVCGAQTVRIPSRFGFEIPGFKHGQRIDPDEIGQRSFDRQKDPSEEAAKETPPPPAPPKEPRPANGSAAEGDLQTRPGDGELQGGLARSPPEREHMKGA